jgi:hypothetical protein
MDTQTFLPLSFCTSPAVMASSHGTSQESAHAVRDNSVGIFLSPARVASSLLRRAAPGPVAGAASFIVVMVCEQELRYFSTAEKKFFRASSLDRDNRRMRQSMHIISCCIPLTAEIPQPCRVVADMLNREGCHR